MPEVYNPAVVKLISRGSLAASEILNVTHWQRNDGTPANTSQLLDLSARWITWWTASVVPLVGPGYVLSEVVATAMDPPPALQLVVTGGLPVAGTAGGEMLPSSIAACVTISAGTTGRSSRGRVYLAGLTETSTVGSIIQNTTLTAINAAFIQLLANTPGGAFDGWIIGVYSTELAGLKRTTGLFSPATTVQMRDNVVDSQRRRLPGRGR